MLHGSYRKKAPNFHKLLAFNFRPCLQRDMLAPGGCGTLALSLLTGHKQTYVGSRFPKTRDYWTDRAMCSYLRNYGYTVLPLTTCCVTHYSGDIKYPIKSKHVLLVGQWMVRDEGSWSVLYSGKYYHNMIEKPIDPLEFINHPIDRAYLISHKKWR